MSPDTALGAGPLEPDVDDAPVNFEAMLDREIAYAVRVMKVWDQVFGHLLEPPDPPERYREWQDVAADEAGVRRFGPP